MRKRDTIPSTLFRLPGVENKRNSIHVMHRFRPWNVAFFAVYGTTYYKLCSSYMFVSIKKCSTATITSSTATNFFLLNSAL